jgi:hypothetical protein
MQNPRTAALLSSAPEQQETHFATSNNKSIEPPYVRIAIHPHAWCENVPTRLQDTVSPTQWQALGRELQPILLQNHAFDKYLTLLVIFGCVAFIAVAATTDPWAHVTGDENVRLTLTMGIIALLAVGYQAVQMWVQNWQQRALESVCRSAEETTFRSLGWALDGRYQGSVACCRTPSVIYFNPLGHLRNGGSGDTAVPPCLPDKIRDLEESLARQGCARILLAHYKVFGFQWSPIFLSHLESFATLPNIVQPRSEHVWNAFWSKLMNRLNHQLLAHRVAVVVSWVLVVCLVLLPYLGDIGVLNAAEADMAFPWLFQIYLVLVLIMGTKKPYTDLLVHKHVHELAKHGLYVECRRGAAPTNHGCGGGQSLYLYLYPIPDCGQVPA